MPFLIQSKRVDATQWKNFSETDFPMQADAQNHIDNVILPSPLYKNCPEKIEFRVVQKQADELTFLQWFYASADFGPGSSDVLQTMRENFVQETGFLLPANYEDETPAIRLSLCRLSG